MYGGGLPREEEGTCRLRKRLYNLMKILGEWGLEPFRGGLETLKEGLETPGPFKREAGRS